MELYTILSHQQSQVKDVIFDSASWKQLSFVLWLEDL